MKVIHHRDCLLHNPPHEILSGKLVPYAESPERIELIWKALVQSGQFDLSDDLDHEIDVEKCIMDVHDPEYVVYLQTAYVDWVNDGGSKEAVLPESFAHVALAAKGANLLTAIDSPIAKAGLYCFDLSCPITADTYKAVIASTHVALTAAKALLCKESGSGVFALCRPPGHHAGSALCGGYCFVNNVAVATRYLQTTRTKKAKVAILDIDYHHGNGTQEIFYEDSTVLYVSIHAENDYPYFTGTVLETGAGEGLNYNVNIPLPRAITDDKRYLSALDIAIERVLSFTPEYLVISLGVDTHENDPLGDFRVTTPAYHEIGRRIRAVNVPTLFIMEGGYYLQDIGESVTNVLLGHKGAEM